MSDTRISRRLQLSMSACFLTSLITARGVKAQEASNNSFMTNQEPIKDSLVEIWSETLIGIGFIGDMNGKQYIFTSTNVISGHMKLQFKTLSGKQLQPSKIELSATRDLARIQVSQETALKLTPTVTVDEAVTVLEYHTSAIMSHSGVITGSSKDMVELSVKFGKESNGSPVLNREKTVLGVANHLIYYKGDAGNWAGTPRSFAYKLDDAAWYTANWRSYNQTYGKSLRAVDEFRDLVYGVASEWIQNPKRPIELEESGGLDFDRWVKEHNGMISDLSKKKSKGSAGEANIKIQKRFQESCDALIQVCNAKAKYLDFLCEDKKITQYLRIQFKWRALELKKFSRFIADHAEQHARDRWM